ncbi:hypothetical protein, partial [Jutongia sp.]
WFVNFSFSVCHNKRPPMILIFYHRRPLYCLIYRNFFTGSSWGKSRDFQNLTIPTVALFATVAHKKILAFLPCMTYNADGALRKLAMPVAGGVSCVNSTFI